jgi:hypothetical protein
VASRMKRSSRASRSASTFVLFGCLGFAAGNLGLGSAIRFLVSLCVSCQKFDDGPLHFLRLGADLKAELDEIKRGVAANVSAGLQALPAPWAGVLLRFGVGFEVAYLTAFDSQPTVEFGPGRQSLDLINDRSLPLVEDQKYAYHSFTGGARTRERGVDKSSTALIER